MADTKQEFLDAKKEYDSIPAKSGSGGLPCRAGIIHADIKKDIREIADKNINSKLFGAITIADTAVFLREIASQLEEQIKSGQLGESPTLGEHYFWNWKHRIFVMIGPAVPCNEAEANEFVVTEE